MSAVKHAFEKIGEGIKHAFEGIGHAVEGLGKTVAGVLTANPKEIKAGLGDIAGGAKEAVSGVGEVAGGVGAAAVGASPLGAAINAMTGGKASNFVQGVGDSAAQAVNNGIDGVGQFADGIAKGNVGEAFSGLANAGQAALMFVPGAGEADLAMSVAMNAGKQLVKQGVEGQVQSGIGLHV